MKNAGIKKLKRFREREKIEVEQTLSMTAEA